MTWFSDEERIDAQVDAVAAQALAVGGLVAMALGVVCAALLGVSFFLTGDRFFIAPLALSVAGAVSSFVIRQMSLRGGLPGPRGDVTMLAFTALPGLFFVAAELTEPIGAAGYLTGPITYLWPFCVVATGFLLRPRLCVVSGAFAAAQFLAVYAVARPRLQGWAAAVPDLGRDLSLDLIWAFKALMFVGVGLALAAIVLVARRLVSRVLEEEREVQAVSKLFGEFVSADVRDKILRERGALKSERRRVAVLFSDLRGFTTYSERTDPAVVVDRLNVYFDKMVEAIEREGGVVDKFIGDAVMATFGGVVPLENAASAALRAARAMRSSLAELNAAWARDGVPPFDNGIGIHFGDVIEGPLGSARRREYTVIGDTVNTASRLEGLTKDKGRGVLATKALVDALPEDERRALDDLGEVQVKGRAEPLRIFGG